jgi:hypothetical protein
MKGSQRRFAVAIFLMLVFLACSSEYVGQTAPETVRVETFGRVACEELQADEVGKDSLWST